MAEMQEAYLVQLPEQATAVLHPLRGEILAQLSEPASATEVARKIGEKPQRVNYHLKILEKVGLVRRVGTRQVKNLVEVLYQAVARSFILADSLGVQPEMLQRLQDQHSLAHLIYTSEQIKKDALLLMDQTDEGEVISSATLSTQIYLASEGEREAFVQEYVSMLKELASKYQSKEVNHPYQVVLAVYPEPRKEEENESK
ncbi:winged helix-turn-helix domain-containing protein [Thermoflavimicrobium daqui]|jgi:DNA-binding transcriptional ArsR family regulator|uniref:ArsR family transcriptional regulator n=1 Tax=Thermoflavimicrobium daqui TaxID=2137476 RepID=A0A364K2L8_9BACL|nr:helix-turn-helix domain-containing protein [Thermoflavimicrobium daqui]RAL22549.1 ArsR family transcriptional regulator [Thermoflavimicrobium daqui]